MPVTNTFAQSFFFPPGVENIGLFDKRLFVWAKGRAARIGRAIQVCSIERLQF